MGELYKQDKWVTLQEVPEVMRSIGVEKGFSRAALARKMRNGSFDVKYHLSGKTKLFRPTDIVAWWNSQPYYQGASEQPI